MFSTLTTPQEPLLNEKAIHEIGNIDDGVNSNPVIDSAKYIYEKTKIVELNPEGIESASRYIHSRLLADAYSPGTWRTQPLHLCPPPIYSAKDPRTRATLDWIFLISSLNFSFWSELEGQSSRYAIQWLEGWGSSQTKSWTGYWSLLAAINRALEAHIPITDPAFYSSELLCPDSLIADIFTAASDSAESIPLLRERIMVLREVGFILCSSFGGSFQGFLEEFQRRNNNAGTALQLVHVVTETFPSFRDETWYHGRQVFFWKRAQILVAETWAAFYPVPPPGGSNAEPHPFFPNGIEQLTMFADYRVPQILHHLRLISYTPALLSLLRNHVPLAPGSPEELCIRAASILAVEAIRDKILLINAGSSAVSSVLIDFYLWDLAKSIEKGEKNIEGIETVEMIPAHRTRSIWY
ncbi:hypothetical protein BD410DRAFT_269849 [Rickenella mellea]|uniref:Queuosine 5'-phosphate N-glycosylase/hydrolase n=1 Tax=Rickenella mellea TaxID=50990 RepID=A0A4Y7Q4E2_9AGAM|nr:hypothetical protein BD410DRAFT_269849 [Rickenella mellea]